MKRFKVGQEVIRARKRGYREEIAVEFEPMTITKVGVRYAYAQTKRGTFEERFDGKTGEGTTYRHHEINRIVESQEQFEQEERELEKRQQFSRAMNRWSMFDAKKVPVENIIQAAELLGLNLEEW